tara:strand:+ start:3338 stop:4363 length:1026 start_codon:yes stop_codon:yes gene_type:complete
MKITKQHLRRIIKESMMKDAYGEFQNHILAIGLDQAGEFGVQEIVDYQSRSKTPYPLEHDEIFQIMRDMVDAGMLTGGSFGNSFSVHPDYMQLEEDKRAPEKEFNGQAHEHGRRDAETDNIDYDRYDTDASYAAGVDSLDQDVDIGIRFEEGNKMKITKRQLRRIIKEARYTPSFKRQIMQGHEDRELMDQQSYDLGREDSLASINPQMSDENYMMGYNEAQMDMGMPSVQPPSDSGRGKRLNPDDLKHAYPRGDRRRIKEEKRKLLEYSDYPSHVDLSDTFEDMYAVMEDVMIKYVESGWLSGQDQGSIARDLDKLLDNMNQLNNTLRNVSGDSFDRGTR